MAPPALTAEEVCASPWSFFLATALLADALYGFTHQPHLSGVVIKVDGERGVLDLLFVSPKAHSKGIGYAAWCAVEQLHPEVTVWETVTPYFEKRNIHFYVNRCGFHIVEFFNSHHPDPNDPDMAEELDEQFPDGMFRFEKRIERESRE